ncbi:MAG: nuclease/transposase family protein [Acidimicrobiales bacterium]
MSHHGPALRKIQAPFVVAPPAGARVRTRLFVNDADRAVLDSLGAHLGALASLDLAHRVQEGALDAKAKAESRKRRKRELTSASSSRWAGAITRTTEDAYGLARRNLIAERAALVTRIKKINGRVALAPGETRGKRHGYGSAQERFEKQRRAQVLASRLADVDAQLASGHYRICRGGRRLAHNRHHLEDARQAPEQWRAQWEARRFFISADGESDKAWGNETIRWHPEEGSLEIKLPATLAHVANSPHGRYRLSCQVSWPHRGDDVATQATSGAIRYDIHLDPAKGRWYIDASWKTGAEPVASLEQLRRGPVVAVDLNVGHMALSVLDASGNVLGVPVPIPLVTDGLAASTRDARIRDAISQVLAIVEQHHAGSVVIENLSFDAARVEGREQTGNRPSRGERGKTFRRHISGLPTAKLRDRLTQMAYNVGVAVIAVDPAYTSKWGAQHWLAPLRAAHPQHHLTGHHAASVAIGRRGLGQRLRRRGTSARTSPEDGERATASASEGGAAPTTVVGLDRRRTHRKPEPRIDTRLTSKGCRRRLEGGVGKTVVPTGSRGVQEAQDRSGSPTERESLSLSV